MRHITSDNFLVTVVGIGAVFGVGLILVPDHLLWLFGLQTGAAGIFVGRELGAALLGLSVIFWAARDPWDLPRQVLLGGLVFNSFGLAIALGAIWNGVMSGMGWLLAAIHCVLANGFAYFRHAR